MAILVRIIVLCLLVYAGSVSASQTLGPKMLTDKASITAAHASEPPQSSQDTVGRHTAVSDNPQKMKGALSSLQLRLPKPATRVSAQTAGQHDPAMTAHKQDDTFDLNPDNIARPVTAPLNLFPSKYGMRGFMSAKWLSRHFGLTAGVGIRLKKNQSPKQYIENLNLNTLSENLLFGMGFLIAF